MKNLHLFGERCINCGLTKGAHAAGDVKYPHNLCPGHQSRMDFNFGPGTTFLGSGDFTPVEYDTPACRMEVNS